jgi:Lipocalin-like domain
MRSIFYTINAIIIVSLISLSGCGGSDNPPQALEPLEALAGSSQRTWVITNRSENGGAPSLPTCASDDTLTFKRSGQFDSLIAGTQCNPAETDVKDGMYALSADKKDINFDAAGFKYTGKLIEFANDKLVIEFNLGPGFSIRDTFALKQ